MAQRQRPAGHDARKAWPGTPPHIGTLILLSGLSALGMNIFLPSLPGMTEYFHTDYRLMQLSVALYLGVNAVVQLVVGPIADNMGRRPVILWGLVLFLLATLGCIFSPSAEIFLLFRMCQAVVVVGMVLGRAAVRDIFPGDKAASMIGYVTMGMAIVPMLGPVAGGFLDQLFGWTANFWLLIGLGAATLALTFFDFGETGQKSGKSLIAQFREYPELLRSPRFWGYTLAAAFSAGCFFAYLGGAPFVGTEVYGLDPAALGIYFGIPALGYLVGNFLSGRFSVRAGINRMVLWGCLICAAAVTVSLLVTASGMSSAATFFGFMGVRRRRQRHDHAQRHRRLAVGAAASGRHRLGAQRRNHAGRRRRPERAGRRPADPHHRRLAAACPSCWPSRSSSVASPSCW